MSYKPYSDEEYREKLASLDPKALAYAWIEGYARNLSSDIEEDEGNDVTTEELIYTGLSHLPDSEMTWPDYITRGGSFEGLGTDPTFWDKLAILMNIDIQPEHRSNFFSCSC